jgi:hypothetical protein
MERGATNNFTKVRAQARTVTFTINHEGTPCPTIARVSQNVPAAAMHLDTLPTPSTDGVNKVYHQLRDILSVATEH